MTWGDPLPGDPDDVFGEVEFVEDRAVSGGLMSDTSRGWTRDPRTGTRRPVIVKRPGRTVAATTAGSVFGAFRREARFYGRWHAGRAVAPECLVVRPSELVLADAGSPRTEPTVADVRAALTRLAGLHARTATDPASHAPLDLTPPTAADRRFLFRLGRRGLRHYLRTLGAGDAWAGDVVDLVSGVAEDVVRSEPAEPLVLCHGDLRPPNVVVDALGRVSLVDWQTYRLDHASVDVACLVATSFPSSVRAAVERDLVSGYWAARERPTPDSSELRWAGYRHGAFVSGLALFGHWSLLGHGEGVDAALAEPLRRALALMTDVAAAT